MLINTINLLAISLDEDLHYYINKSENYYYNLPSVLIFISSLYLHQKSITYIYDFNPIIDTCGSTYPTKGSNPTSLKWRQ